jgi:hypothetical protein
MQKNIKILGIACIVIGLIASLLCLIPFGLFLSLPVGFLGMITSTIYVYIDTKNNINTKRFTPGIIGMILSSIPIVIVLFIIIMGSLNK